MNANTEIESSGGALESIKLMLAFALMVGGVVAYYLTPELALVLRVLMVLAGVALGAALGMTTIKGKTLMRFIQGSRVEIRKVVWPTRQETIQVTIAVFIFTFLLGLFFWGLDSILLLLTRAATGQG